MPSTAKGFGIRAKNPLVQYTSDVKLPCLYGQPTAESLLQPQPGHSFGHLLVAASPEPRAAWVACAKEYLAADPRRIHRRQRPPGRYPRCRPRTSKTAATGVKVRSPERTIRDDLKAAGFTQVLIEGVEGVSKASTARDAAIAFCQGTPLRNEIEARDPSRLEEATIAAAKALAQRFGNRVVEGRMRAVVITAMR